MKVKNDFVEIKTGDKKYKLQNLILDELLKRYAKSQIEVGNLYRIYNCPRLEYLLIKFDTPIGNLRPSSELHNADFDVGLIWGNSNVKSLSDNKITVQYQYELDKRDSFYLYGTGVVTGEYWNQLEGKKITALGFNSWPADDTNVINKYPVCAVLDTSNYNIYLEKNQEFSVTRKDIITTDALFYSNNMLKVPGPIHLCPYGIESLVDPNSSLPSQAVLYSIGFSSYPDYIDKELVIGEDIQAIHNGNEISIIGLENYLSTDSPLFSSENIYASEDLYPVKTNYKYIIFKYKIWHKVDNTVNDEVITTYTDTGYYYYQSIPIDKYGKTDLKIKYERG